MTITAHPHVANSFPRLHLSYRQTDRQTHTHTHTLYSSPSLDLWSPQESFVPDCDLPTHQSSWHEIFLNV